MYRTELETMLEDVKQEDIRLGPAPPLLLHNHVSVYLYFSITFLSAIIVLSIHMYPLEVKLESRRVCYIWMVRAAPRIAHCRL